MTEKQSVRASARVRYRAVKPTECGEGDDGVPVVARPAAYVAPSALQTRRTVGPAPDAASGVASTTLIDEVRGLYEDGIVPVREIALRVGVSERTLYKYARRGRWRRRYARAAAGGDVPAQPWSPACGAGGRFVARADAGKPQAHGLKALDPEGRAVAVVRCTTARHRADEAARSAERDMAATHCARSERRALDSRMRALDLLGAALVDLARGHARGGARYAVAAGALQRVIDAEMRRLLAASLSPR